MAKTPANLFGDKFKVVLKRIWYEPIYKHFGNRYYIPKIPEVKKGETKWISS